MFNFLAPTFYDSLYLAFILYLHPYFLPTPYMLYYTLTFLLTIYLLYTVHCRCEEFSVADLPIISAAIMCENSSGLTSQQQNTGSDQLIEEVLQSSFQQVISTNTCDL